MKPCPSVLALLAGVSLLGACPGIPGEVGGDESTGFSLTDGGMTTAVVTTAVDSSGVATADATSDATSNGSTSAVGSSSSDETAAPECTEAKDCDDGSFCNGIEACVGGSCTPGAPMRCDDAVDCTVDSCDDERGTCVHEPDNAVCGCGETCDDQLGCGIHCVPTMCNGQIYQCGNCIDDDADCGVDNLDTDCWGPCDNNESGWSGEVPGQQNQSECNVMDCYFDQNSGTGNDNCYWSHDCDPLEPSGCSYNPNNNIPGTPLGCDQLQMMQSNVCLDFCGPLVPNGCDCFGCCEVQLAMTTVTVYLGSVDANDDGSCNLAVVEDPLLCNPCTQVAACLNTCEMCELCLGQVALPPECEEQECPAGLQGCGLAGQDPCPMGQACVTGCCVPNPQ